MEVSPVLEAERGLDTALSHPEHCGLPEGADMIAQRIDRQGDRERRNVKVCRGAAERVHRERVTRLP